MQVARDPRVVAARRAGLFFLVGGVLALLGSLMPHPMPSGPMVPAALGVVDIVVAWLLYRLPWQQWHPLATVVVVPVAFAIMWAFHSAGVLTPTAFAAFMILVLFWVGLSHPPKTALALSPVFLLSYFWPMGADAQAAHSALVVLPVAVLIAESTAVNLRRLTAVHDREQRRASLYRELAQAMRSMSALEWDKACEEVVRATRHLGFDGASLNLIEHEAGRYEIRHSSGLPDELRGASFTLDVGITGLVLAQRDIVVIEDYASDPRAVPALKRAGFTVVLGAPVSVGDRLVAVLVAMARSRSRLDDDEKEVFRLLADEVAMALSNATSHRVVQDHAARYLEVAMRDELTGIGNRRFGQGLLDRLKPGDGVLLLDLDHFKRINDRQGHAAGDQVLVEFGEFLRRTLRDDDRAARWGGEEFLVVLPRVDGDLEAAADRICRAWRMRSPPTTFSGGAALHAQGVSITDTLARADAALYAAKDGGRDQMRLAAGS